MAKFIVMDVLEVTKVVQYQKKTATGSFTVWRANLLCEGDDYSVEIADGVDIPEGWSGKVYCSATSIKSVSKYSNGDLNSRFSIVPTLIVKFVKGENRRTSATSFDAYFGGVDSSSPDRKVKI